MKILLTGASGAFGRQLLAHLRLDHAITTLGRQPLPGPHITADLTAGPPDLQSRPFDWVIHAAGWPRQPRTPAERAQCFATNVAGLQNLLMALENAPALPQAIVLLSTVKVYGRDAGTLLDETTPTAATDAYGQSKAQAEDVALHWGARTGCRITVLRLAPVVSTQLSGNLAGLQRAIRRGYYVQVGDGQNRRSLVRADDVAAILPRAAEVGGTFNLNDGQHPTLADVALALANNERWPTLPLRYVAPLARLTPFTAQLLGKFTDSLTFSDARARAELGWQPRPVLDLLRTLR